MKKRILSLALAVALMAISVVGTYAYLTDSEQQTNTFTAGNVEIKLDEVIVEKNEDGDLVGTDERTEENQNYHLYPGMEVTKDPTIYVQGTEKAYVAAKITITGNLYDLIGVPGYDNIDIHQLASGGLIKTDATQEFGWNGLSMVYKTDDCVIYQDADKANNTWTLYIFMNDIQAVGTEIVLFDTLTIPAAWDNAEMAKINGMNIDVQAFATQANGFSDCYTAMTTAFADQFKFN